MNDIEVRSLRRLCGVNSADHTHCEEDIYENEERSEVVKIRRENER